LASALSTRATTRYKGDQGEIDIILQMRSGNHVSLQEIQNISFENRRGEMIRLSSVVDYQYRKGPLAIKREDRKAVLSVVGNTEGLGLFMASQLVREALQDLRLPPGYSWSMGQNWRHFQQSQQSNVFSIILAVILMYIIMAALFESFIHPLTILLTVPFSIIGVAGLFYLTNTTLNQMAYLGILVLFGLVVNNGIILIDHINTLRRQGMHRNAAILQGGMDRLRPILMTACTSLFGLMPLTLPFIFPNFFDAVEGRARMWAPVSLAVFGGLTTSTFLTLIILPTMYSYMDDVSRGATRAVHWIGKLGGMRFDSQLDQTTR
ncbi:MAG: efflux RND transporter permease subunit, partial [Acidobacteriota bacterium]